MICYANMYAIVMFEVKYMFLWVFMVLLCALERVYTMEKILFCRCLSGHQETGVSQFFMYSMDVRGWAREAERVLVQLVVQCVVFVCFI